jgi:hypothetical protein
MFEHWHEPVLVDLNITCECKEETSNFGFAIPMRWPQPEHRERIVSDQDIYTTAMTVHPAIWHRRRCCASTAWRFGCSRRFDAVGERRAQARARATAMGGRTKIGYNLCHQSATKLKSRTQRFPTWCIFVGLGRTCSTCTCPRFPTIHHEKRNRSSQKRMQMRTHQYVIS